VQLTIRARQSRRNQKCHNLSVNIFLSRYSHPHYSYNIAVWAYCSIRPLSSCSSSYYTYRWPACNNRWHIKQRSRRHLCNTMSVVSRIDRAAILENVENEFYQSKMTWQKVTINKKNHTRYSDLLGLPMPYQLTRDIKGSFNTSRVKIKPDVHRDNAGTHLADT